MRPLATVDRVAAAILHPQQFVLALVEFVVADGGDLKPHHRQRFDGGLVVEHRRQERAGADQVAGGDEDRVAGCPSRSCLTSVAMCSAPPAATAIFLVLSAGSAIRDAARRRLQIAVEIVDRENAQLDRRGVCAVMTRRAPARSPSARIGRSEILMALKCVIMAAQVIA